MTGLNLDPGCVLAEDGKIAEIAARIPEDDTMHVIDACGAWTMPGLIDAHSHLGITEERKGKEGDDGNESTQPTTPYLRAIDAINPLDISFKTAVRAGITSAMVGPGSSNVVGGLFAFMKTAGNRIDDMIVLFPAALKAALGENPKTTYGSNGNMPSTRMAIAFMLREALYEGAKYKKDKDSARQSGQAFEEQIRLEPFIPLFEGKIPLKTHAHRADDIQTAIRIAKEFNISLTLDHCTEGHFIPEQIAESGFPAIVGPSIASRNKIETQFLDFKTVGVLHKAGVKVAVTTDHPVSLIQYLPVCAGLAAREGLGIEEGLKSITINAAEICRVSDRVGTLEVGKDADIAVFDGNPMEIFTKPLYTVIDGILRYSVDESGPKS
ncbi:MAG: N-substituted formamide deformylase precursor [Firmicutes bacterium ADurb.Bin182]|nr:MAG: N-substituted formamide deformylase precursor [Firmicutes bacterium ADurb.Bin182]